MPGRDGGGEGRARLRRTGAGMTLPVRADFRFFHPHRVRYVELDTQGIVFNAHYLTWYDEAVSDYIRATGWDYQAEVKATGADVGNERADRRNGVVVVKVHMSGCREDFEPLGLGSRLKELFAQLEAHQAVP